MSKGRPLNTYIQNGFAPETSITFWKNYTACRRYKRGLARTTGMELIWTDVTPTVHAKGLTKLPDAKCLQFMETPISVNKIQNMH
jgi:hypothetical protein